MAGSAERPRKIETVENITLDLLAVVAGGATAFLITQLLLSPTQAGDVGQLQLLSFFAAFAGVGWWRSWQACLLALLFGASFVTMTVWDIRPAELAGFLPPLVLAAYGLTGALVGAGLEAVTRRWRRREDPAALAARRGREASLVMACGVAFALTPFVVAVVLRPKGDEGIIVGFMMFATWPIALLLLVLGLMMLGRR